VGRFEAGGAEVALWVRLPAGLRAPGPVAPRDAQLPFPLGGDGGEFRGCGPTLWATMLRGAHGAVDPPTPDPWHDDILARFAGVVRRPDAPEVPNFTKSHGSTNTWFRKYSVRSSIYRVFIVSFFSL
jgi:hypothetical protein